MNKKLLTIFIAILLVLMGAISYLFTRKPATQYLQPNNSITSTQPVYETVYKTLEWGIPIVYSNEQYGFKFALPESWTGYKLIKNEWQTPSEGMYVAGKGNITAAVTTGPIIIFRNPSWTKDKPYQDIPVMVFTLDQWNGLGTKYAYPWAGGIPEELGRNSKYIFILTPRYNFIDGVTGISEVDSIMQSKTFKAF